MKSIRSLESLPRAARRQRRSATCVAAVASIAIGVAVFLPTASSAAPAIGLGTATSFAVLAGSGITNSGPTTITGDIGSFPTPTMTGLGSVTLNGTNNAGNTVTQQAKTNLVTAYDTAENSGPSTAHAVELGGDTLTPGVYTAGTFGITGTLTLNTQGDPNAVFIFQVGSTLTTASNSSVIVQGGGTACNVFWQIGTSATLGTGSHLIGTVMAMQSITATTGATIQGRLLARNGAVTLDTNTITRPVCAAAATTTAAGPSTTAGGGTATTAPSGGAPTTVPESGTPGSGTPGGPGTPGAPGTPAPPLPETH